MPADNFNKKRKLFQVAKELNLAHTTLMEFLNSKGFDTPKKHMSLVSPEMYEEIIKHFDLKRWKKYQEKLESRVEESKSKEAEKLREAEIERILHSKVNVETTVEEEARAEAEPDKEVVEPDVSPKKVDIPLEDKDTDEEKEETVEPSAVIPVEEPKVEPTVEAVEESGVSEEVKEVEHRNTVDEVVAEALKYAAKRKPKSVPAVAEEPVKMELDEAEKVEDISLKKKKKKHKLGKRKKKPRRPEVPSAAVLELEREKRIKIKKPPKPKDEIEEKPKRKHKRGKKRKKVDLKEVDASIKETLAKIEDRSRGRKKKKKVTEVGEEIEVVENELQITEFASAQELANLMDVSVNEVIKKALEMGLLISINQRLDRDTITLLADEFEYTVKFISTEEVDLDSLEDIDAEAVPRAPVVTVMGHVDHGKTSLLDYIRRSNIIAGEAGRITQHIGAYKLLYKGRYITFLDTPGHEAFTAMRARGAQVTDIVVLVIAADDQVMPQTIEAINHAQAANVPIVIAINKIDKDNAQPERVKQQLADHNILVEEWGGKYQCVEISAKYGRNVNKLMEEILLLADLIELKAPVDCRAKGVVIDSKLDRGRGALATVLIQRGTLRVGDFFVAGQYSGKVRALLDERGNKVNEAGPSDPVLVLGFEGTPDAGDTFFVTPSEKESRSISLRRRQLNREQNFRQIKMMTLDQISDRIKYGEVMRLMLIIKGDVHGSVEALADSLMKLRTEEVGVNVIHKGVGAITESDVLLASASNAIIIGFHVHANKKARELAARERVEIKMYRIIYDVVEDIKRALEGMLKPEVREEVVGEIEVRDVFKISSIGTIAGCYVNDGKIDRSMKVKLYRNGVQIYDGEIESLKRFKEDVKEVASGFECGIKLKDFNDIKVGDIIEPYKIVETKRALNV